MSEVRSLAMDWPVEYSLLDGQQGVIGRPLDRLEGPLKVSGQAHYAAEHRIENVAYGYLVQAKVGRGQVEAVQAEAARAMPGVIEVVVDLDGFIRNSQQGTKKTSPHKGVREVDYFRQPVALVVAETYEQARAAGEAINVKVAPAQGRFDFEAHLDETVQPPDSAAPARSAKGDIDHAMREAAVTVDEVWTTPSQNSCAMEPHASTAVWDEAGLTLYGSYQMLAPDRLQLADALDLDKAQVRIVSPYVGGGFGSKLGIAVESVAAAIAARKVGRPVKVAMTRQQVFDATVRRSNTRQRIRLGAREDGRLIAIGHETIAANLPGEDFFEPAGVSTMFLYAGDNRCITHDLVHMNLVLSGSMRAPGEAAGMLALEAAMDELAEKLGMDPVELRKCNDPAQDPGKDIPFSSRYLTRCLDEGAARFGWADRNRTPGGLRQGDWLVGHGMAAASRSNKLMKSEARVTITPEGRAVVETDMTDIGTGTYTILGQIAAEVLGLGLDQVDVRLGDTRFPAAAGSGGSFGAASSGTSVYLACQTLREKLARGMNCPPEALTLKDGRASIGDRSRTLAELAGAGLSAEGCIEPGKTDEDYTQASYGAHFCEVHVNTVTGETRVKRWVGVFDAGRVLNEKTARSQCFGGIIFGIGAALMEELVHDVRTGKVVNRDMAEYHIPVHADAPPIDVVFLDERDKLANPLHAKGIGELGITGAGAAVANAIYNATGIRVRDYPLTLDKLLDRLPPIA
jgi:xanthine dehydrogenase YagR molybdenum-binding subunit